MILSALGIINNLGDSKENVLFNAISGNQDKLIENHLFPDKTIYTGDVTSELPSIINETYNFRANQLLLHCFYQIETGWSTITSKYKLSRIGIVLGSNNAGIEKFENYFGDYFINGVLPKKLKTEWLENGTLVDFLKEVTKAKGPGYGISTACSSSAKAFAVARNFIEQDICDAVLVGGVDDLCSFTIRGFNALGAYSKGKTNPFSRNRDGINIGEGAALFIMEKGNDGIKLMGIGESSDAYHITSPDPNGKGAILSMKRALADAQLDSEEIDYINLHGTGTFHNDLAETKAVNEVFPDKHVVCASTKSLTGHLLGAAGAVEAGFCWLMLSDYNRDGKLIPHIYDGIDMENPLNFVQKDSSKSIRYCLSNSFAFGGSNATIILGV